MLCKCRRSDEDGSSEATFWHGIGKEVSIAAVETISLPTAHLWLDVSEISALPTYRFEAKICKNTKANKDKRESHSEGGGYCGTWNGEGEAGIRCCVAHLSQQIRG